MTTNEVVDSFTKYLHVIKSFAQNILEDQDATSNLTASNIIATMQRILTQDMERVRGRSLMASPFAVRIRGVACPETADTNVLKVKLREIATSEVYRSAFKASDVPRVEDLHTEVIQTGEWDASNLACLAQYSPEAIISPLLAKATKSEVLAPMLSWRERREVQNSNREKSYEQLAHVFELDRPHMSVANAKALAETDSCELTGGLRERFYEANGYRVINHTMPYPLAMLAHRPLGKSLEQSWWRMWGRCGRLTPQHSEMILVGSQTCTTATQTLALPVTLAHEAPVQASHRIPKYVPNPLSSGLQSGHSRSAHTWMRELVRGRWCTPTYCPCGVLHRLTLLAPRCSRSVTA